MIGFTPVTASIKKHTYWRTQPIDVIIGSILCFCYKKLPTVDAYLAPKHYNGTTTFRPADKEYIWTLK